MLQVLVRRSMRCLVFGATVFLLPVSAFAAPGPTQPTSPQAATTSAATPPAAATWAVTLGDATLRSGPNDNADMLADAPAMTLLQVLRYDGGYAYVANPRTHETAYVSSDSLGPSDPPSRYLTMTPPAPKEEFDARGIVTDSTPLAMYPTSSDEATERDLSPNTWLSLDATVQGDDGSMWYRTQDGDYVSAGAVFVPQRIDDFSGRWLDVNLNTPARVTAYEGDTLVRSFLTIKGAGPRPTPTGVFTILRRVANETMDSSTIGIPRNGPGGYYLTGVLFTQYFTVDGASLHYNYWSSMWGYPGSHGCLGLTYADSAWLWEWAHVGTPVDIHY